MTGVAILNAFIFVSWLRQTVQWAGPASVCTTSSRRWLVMAQGGLMQGFTPTEKDTKGEANNKFIAWLTENGIWTSTSSSSWGKARHPLSISSRVEDDGEVCGRGLLAREGISQGELMLTIPLDLCLNKAQAESILGKEVISDDLDEYIAIALLLIHERAAGTKSRWAPYIELLPFAEEVYPSFLWKEADLDLLRGSPVYAASQSLRAKLLREHAAALAGPASRLSHGPSLVTQEAWLWAFTVLFSRAARLPSKQGGEVLTLVPYADLINHSPYSDIYIDSQRAGLPVLSSREEIALYADRSFKKFEQVFINYGEKSNADLLLLYGFALDRNPFDAVDVTVGLSSQDPLYAKKQAYLNQAGRGQASVRFPLQQGRYPSQLVDFLRLLLAEPIDVGLLPWEAVDFNSPLTPGLEVRVLRAIIDICEAYLAGYPSTLAQDEELVRDSALFSALDRHQRMAIRLRVSEKRILMDTIEAVRKDLAGMDMGGEATAAERGRGGNRVVVAAGRGFDPLR